jgi:hypothetical protein
MNFTQQMDMIIPQKNMVDSGLSHQFSRALKFPYRLLDVLKNAMAQAAGSQRHPGLGPEVSGAAGRRQGQGCQERHRVAEGNEELQGEGQGEGT